MKKNTKRRNTVARRRLKAVLVAVSCLLLVSLISVGGTMAWLVATSTDVKNTFTAGDINIELEETALPAGTTAYKMVPGNKIAKDPKVTVEANSEACWLFVEITKGGSYDTFLKDYVVRTGTNEWIKLTTVTGVDNVYYREVPASEDDQSFYVLQGADGYPNGYVEANTSFTKQDVEKMKDTTNTTVTPPTLTFMAYAVQKDNVATVGDAWNIAKGTTSGN